MITLAGCDKTAKKAKQFSVFYIPFTYTVPGVLIPVVRLNAVSCVGKSHLYHCM